MSIVIQTPRLNIREWSIDDVDPYIDACNTPTVMEYLGGPRSAAAVRKEVKDFISQQQEYGFTLWALEERSTGEFIGFCGLDQLDYLEEGEFADRACTVKNELELGFRLKREFWGRSLAPEASAAVLLVAFERLRARRVVSRAKRENVGSRKVLEGLGFRHDFGLDYWASSKTMNVVYTMDHSEWPSSPAHARLIAFNLSRELSE